MFSCVFYCFWRRILVRHRHRTNSNKFSCYYYESKTFYGDVCGRSTGDRGCKGRGVVPQYRPFFREILSAFWENTDQDPDVASFQPNAQAELLRLCGVFLSQFGRARGLPDYQLRAKDLLTRSAEIFEDVQRPDKAAEAKVCLANCFWFLGEIAEYDDILQAVEADFDEKPEHTVSIQIKLNRMLVAVSRAQPEEALRLVDEISRLLSSDHDFRLRTQFHNLAGIACRVAGNLEGAALHAREAVLIAREAGNPMFVALSLNNLAFVYRTAGEFDLAHQTVDESISIMESHLDRGWVAHALDTKALIYIDQRDCESAMATIERSIRIFEEGEDYSGLADAMWNKCVCLMRLGRKQEAIVLFGQVPKTSRRKRSARSRWISTQRVLAKKFISYNTFRLRKRSLHSNVRGWSR